MIIDCISDLHGYYPKLEGGDLLIVAGDLTARDTIIEFGDFRKWLEDQEYKKKIVIAGNHDNSFKKSYTSEYQRKKFGTTDFSWEYLYDSGTEFEGLKIWGSPWTKSFPGMNPKCKAFTLESEEELNKYWCAIPKDIDILITHSPPFSFLDQVKDYSNGQIENVGSKTLSLNVATLSSLKLHVFGHIHESYGEMKFEGIKFVNASHVNERYKPVNKPIRVIL